MQAGPTNGKQLPKADPPMGSVLAAEERGILEGRRIEFRDLID